MKISAVVLAGGKGSRMNSDIQKQYLLLCGKPVLYYALQAFQHSSVDEIILVVGTGMVQNISEEEYCKKEFIDNCHFNKIKHIVMGGSERYDSVMNGLAAIHNDVDYILIHDGARPCITVELIERCIQDVIDCKACVAAVPVKDTIKVVDSKNYAVSTPDRSTLWQIQTPQCFEYNMIWKAYHNMAADTDKSNITDDAMVVEKYSDNKVKMTYSSYKNIKITTPEDLQIAKTFLFDKLLEDKTSVK